MSAVVRIPTVLRPAMAGATTSYPSVKGQLLNDDGTLHRFLNVYVNDDDVRYLGGVDAAVAGDDEITLLPAVAGGAR